MIDGAMKMPEPIIEPTMIVVAEKTPRRRSSTGAGGMPAGARRYFTTRRYGGSSRFLRVGPATGRGVGAGATTGRTGEADAREEPGGGLSGGGARSSESGTAASDGRLRLRFGFAGQGELALVVSRDGRGSCGEVTGGHGDDPGPVSEELVQGGLRALGKGRAPGEDDLGRPLGDEQRTAVLPGHEH